MAEIVGELDRVAEFVAEFEIDGNVGVEMLLNADEFKSRWTLVGGRTHDAAAHDGTARTLRNSGTTESMSTKVAATIKLAKLLLLCTAFSFPTVRPERFFVSGHRLSDTVGSYQGIALAIP